VILWVAIIVVSLINAAVTVKMAHVKDKEVFSGIHPVREALKAGRALDRVLIARGAGGPRVQEIVDLSRRAQVSVRFEDREALDRASGIQSHQGVVAFGAATENASLEEVSSTAKLLVVLDGIEDPHNLGAIIRTANAAGADAVVIPERRAAGLTGTVAKAAAGALEYVPVVRIANVTRTLDELKNKGYWIYGLDERGREAYDEIDYAEKAVIVLGGEGSGLHQLVREHCDVMVRIPMAGSIPSLNVSVAAGIVLFEWKKKTDITKRTQSQSTSYRKERRP
jgi:23S rRNA (guanosine2251-2'-O)-methyltransferase